MEFWKYGILEIWNFGNMKFWKYEILEIWNFGNMEFWKYEILEIWKYGNLEIWNFGNMEFWKYEYIYFWGTTHKLNFNLFLYRNFTYYFLSLLTFLLLTNIFFHDLYFYFSNFLKN